MAELEAGKTGRADLESRKNEMVQLEPVKVGITESESSKLEKVD